VYSFNPSLKKIYQQQWQGELEEYVTALDWSINGDLAVSSAQGEVILKKLTENTPIILLTPENTGFQSVDCLQFSGDGQFLAVGAQDGKVRVWQLQPELILIETLELGKFWIEHLAWHPHKLQLAFSFGDYGQIWDAVENDIVTTLPFLESTVLDLQWHPTGEYIAMAGNGGISIWTSSDWDDDPFLAEMPGACNKMAWSPDGAYLAGNCFDNSVWIWCWENLETWHLSGFGAKIRNLSWSKPNVEFAPLLSLSCLNGVVIWQKEENDDEGWGCYPLEGHSTIVEALKFHPENLLIASADEEGMILLWDKAQKLIQRLTGVANGFSKISWHPQGKYIAAGGKNGEILVWQKIEEKKGKGF